MRGFVPAAAAAAVTVIIVTAALVVPKLLSGPPGLDNGRRSGHRGRAHDRRLVNQPMQVQISLLGAPQA